MKATTAKKPTRLRKTAIPVTPTAESKPESVAMQPRTVRRGSCATLNQKGELAYEVGVDGRGEVQLRVVENSGTGSFSDDWVSLKSIQAAFDRAPKGEPVSAHMLLPLFRGRSTNCTYFCAAVLKSEGLLLPSEKRRKRFDRVDPAAWLAETRQRAESRSAETTGETNSRKPAVTKAGASKPKKSNKTAKT